MNVKVDLPTTIATNKDNRIKTNPDRRNDIFILFRHRLSLNDWLDYHSYLVKPYY